MSQHSSSAGAPLGRSRRPVFIAIAALAAVLGSAIAFPRDGVDAAPLNSAGWTTNATSSPTSVPRGTTATVSVTVKSSTTRRGLVDVEIYGPSGRVFQQFWDNQSFTKNVSRTFTARWIVPTSQALGARTIKVGMFGAGWNPFQHWNDSAGTFNVTAAGTTTGPPRPPAQPPTRLNWVGSNFFATGVNVPWMTWPFAPGHGDFGGGNSDGVVARRAEIAVGFAKLQASGTHVVRWWAFQGDAWQINRDANGRPTSLNPAIYADFDAAISLANQYDLYYNFVLFGGPNQFPSTWRTDPAQRAQLATVLGPLFARYKDNPRVMSWEIFNEPEWEIWNSGGAVSEAHVKAMAVEIIKSIRLNAPKTLVTVGQALVGGFNSNQRAIAMWTDVDLDFYSPHWYSPHTSPFSICAMCTTAPDLQALYNTTKPIVIGEFDQGLESSSANTARLNQWYTKNYAGAWGWSLFPENTGDGIPTDFVALTNFNSQHSDIGPRTP